MRWRWTDLLPRGGKDKTRRATNTDITAGEHIRMRSLHAYFVTASVPTWLNEFKGSSCHRAMLLDCFLGHALADVVSWPCRCCHVVAVALPVSAVQCLCRVFTVLFLCLRCVFTVSLPLPWLSRAMLYYCCDFAISLLRPCRWLAVPMDVSFALRT